MAEFQTFNIIEEVTRNDGSTYKEIGNLLHNGQAEYAAEAGYIKAVRILKINIPHSTHVERYEEYVNKKFSILDKIAIPEWIEWNKTPEILAEVEAILAENQVS